MLTLARRTALLANSPTHAGAEIHQKMGVTKAVYDFAVQGGTVGAIELLDDAGDPVVMPDNAIVFQTTIDILTAFVSTGNNGTIALSLVGANDILSAVDADTLSGVNDGVPDGSGAAMVKMTSALPLTLTFGTNNITAGKMNVFLFWILSD